MFEIAVNIISYSFFLFLLGLTIFTFGMMVLFIPINMLLKWIRKSKSVYKK